MKKQFLLLLMVVFLIMMLPLVSYAESTTVVFVDGTVEISGNGSAPDAAVKTIEEEVDSCFCLLGIYYKGCNDI